MMMDDAKFWRDYPSPVRSDLSRRLHFSQPLFLIYSSLPSPSFIPGEISCSSLDFTVRKPNTRTQKGGGMKEGVNEERPTSNLATGCEGVTLASTLSHSFTLFLSLLGISSVTGELNICVHSGVSEVTILCKITQHIHSKPGHKTRVFVFP